MRTSVIVFTISIFLAFCSNRDKKEKEWSELPPETAIDSFPQTDFVPTLENPMQPLKNIIYAPAVLYAWEEIRKAAGPVILDTGSSEDLRLINRSASFQKSLQPHEYETEVMEDDGAYHIRAFFNKTLPFREKMQRKNRALAFDSVSVDYFGMNSYDGGIASQAEILYYKDDDHFVMRLIPQDTLNEIILAKGIRLPLSLARGLKEAYEMIGTGKKNRFNPKQEWRYVINEEDVFHVPVIEFNIWKEFHTLIGQTFQGRARKHRIEYFYQRTGLILNENGAVVESEVAMSTDTGYLDPDIPRPKRMLFDKPFIIIIKKRNSPNPYFVMWVANSELMKKD